MAYIGNAPATGENNSFKILDDITSYTLTFNGSYASVVSLADDTITKNEHRFITGQRVTYTHGGGTAIGGLTSGSVYYIVKNDQNTIKLAPSYADAIGSTNLINLSALGTGSSHTLNVAFDGVNTKFKATYDNGTKAGITRAAQLQISINGVIQRPYDSVTPPSGFGFDLDSVIVFSTAPVSTDVFWGNLVANNFPTFDIADNEIDNFIGDATTVSYTLSKTPANSQNILVTLDGVVQYPSDNDTTRAYTLSENVLTFDSAPGAGVFIQVRHIGFAGATSSSVTGFYGRTGNVALRHIDNVKVGNVDSVGVSTFTTTGVGTVTIGIGTTALLVEGNARVTGILTVGNSSITIDGDTNKISIGDETTFIQNGAIGIGTTNLEGNALKVTGTTDITGNTTIGGNVNLKSLDYAGISSTISDTAVDVFVYDTSKDSDGGAWRYKTQRTSWYNETLNTATRGSRREFPAVAVIVLGSDFITIYDGDDPDMPMWMKFISNTTSGNSGGSHFVWSPCTLSSIVCKNGLMGWSDNGSAAGWYEANFISEKVIRREGGSLFARWAGNFSQRNGGSTFLTASPLDVGGIVNWYANDSTMTVLPNAPIDPDTGLQVPTIAVATNGGVSVIKDDGSVVDMVSTAPNNDVLGIKFIGDNKLMIRCQNSGAYANIHQASIHEIPSSDESAGYYSSLPSHIVRYTGADVASGLAITPASYASSDVDIDHIEHLKTNTTNNLAFGFNDRLTLVKETNIIDTVEDNASVAFATTSYNTGWMHGDIKGAFLSDTDATNIVNHSSGNLINYNGNDAGDFNSADDLNAWTGSGLSHDAANSRLVVDKSINGTFSVVGILTIGKRYEISWDVASQSPSYGKVMLNSTTAGSAVELEAGSGTGSYKFTATGTDLNFYLFNGGGSHVANINSITIVPVVDDRSVNNNGLQVFGTITKSAVATGAELVGYSGNGTTDYLEQPYNSDLDFGANTDFSVMGWMYNTNVGGGQVIFDRSVTYNSSRDWQLWVAADLKYMTMYIAGGQATVTPNGSFPNNVWFHFAAVRSGGTIKIYINSVEKSSNSSTLSTIPASNVPMKVLYNCNSNTKLSLLRLSASAPSEEQIKKIYEDEKVLFQENAACTLYGSSDAVTALAYDEVNDLLHVGTSSGRSDFNGLRRINNTTTAVTTAISAYDGLIAAQ
jgi:hypothetical protein